MKKYKHHEETIKKIIEIFSKEDNILAVLLGGSIAHGYATIKSDVDIIIVVTEEEYKKRKEENKLLYFNNELCDYSDCYVDGKYIDENYLNLVAEKGNEPTRYAFKDCMFLISNSEEIEKLVKKIPIFNKSTKEINAKRFYAQMHAWKWYYYEGKRHNNNYLISTAIDNFLLYTCRVILNQNEQLYPYYKWMLVEVDNAKIKPKNIINNIQKLIKNKNQSIVEKITKDIKEINVCEFGDWDWPGYFYKDVETIWMQHESYISDI